MGAIRTLMNTIASQSAEQIREELSKAEAKHASALTTWSEDESAARWKVVEDAERDAKQLRVRLARAEKLEREAADARTSADREKEIAALGDLAKRINESGAKLQKRANEIAVIATALVKHDAELVADSDQLNADLRTLEQRAARLGVPAPKLEVSALANMSMAVRFIQREVQKEHVRNGVEYQASHRAVALVEGSHQ